MRPADVVKVVHVVTPVTREMSQTMSDHETYTITLTNAANRHETRPVAVRLQTLLNLIQRGFGLRCIDIRPVEIGPGSTGEIENQMSMLE